MSEALKYDGEKLRWDLVPFRAVEGMIKVLMYGMKKYTTPEASGAHNWRKGFLWTRLIGAAFRHLTAIAKGEDIDPESLLPHIDHLMCCVAFLSEHMKAPYGEDDRYKESD
jgi:hypothetical protein